MKSRIRKYIPESVLSFYHAAVAFCAAFVYDFPARKMIMIGITGTKGKTSTANFIWSVLQESGVDVGLIGTANIRIGAEEQMNPYHMTMPGPFIMQKLLREMRSRGCRYVITEATSEGMKLNRHLFMYYDIAIFTNLTPEHLPAHGGSFEKYKEAKSRLFKSLAPKEKHIDGKDISKLVIVNADSEHAGYYLSFDVGKKMTFGISAGDIRARILAETDLGTSFLLDGDQYVINLLGTFNVYNALPAIVVGAAFGMSKESIQTGISRLQTIPGRMEQIHGGQPFTVIVDYAHEKASMDALLGTALRIKKSESKIIVVFGAQGGGRDKMKRQWMGLSAGEKADYVILTSDDSYEENPLEIMSDIARFVQEKGKKFDRTLFLVEDRRLAIRKAFSLAEAGDIVLLAGKGAEQFIISGNDHVPWDERVVAREELKPYSSK